MYNVSTSAQRIVCIPSLQCLQFGREGLYTITCLAIFQELGIFSLRRKIKLKIVCQRESHYWDKSCLTKLGSRNYVDCVRVLECCVAILGQ